MARWSVWQGFTAVVPDRKFGLSTLTGQSSGYARWAKAPRGAVTSSSSVWSFLPRSHPGRPDGAPRGSRPGRSATRREPAPVFGYPCQGRRLHVRRAGPVPVVVRTTPDLLSRKDRGRQPIGGANVLRHYEVMVILDSSL